MARGKIWAGILAFLVVFWALVFSAVAGFHIPPAQYDYVPAIPPLILTLPAHRARAYCRNYNSEACVVGRTIPEGRCLIIIKASHKLPLKWILRHEYGHCNGWPGNHPRT